MTTHAIRSLLFVAAVVTVLACFGKFRPDPPATYSKTPKSGSPWPLAAAAQTTETPPSPGFTPEAVAEGASLLDATIARLARHRLQVTARHTIEFDGQTMIGRGVYMHEPVANPGAGPVVLSRVEFRTSLSADEPEPEFLQVYDGKTLWEYRDIRGSLRVQKLDLADLLTEINNALSINKPLTLGAAPGLGHGGLLQLMHTLRSDLDFVRAAGDPSQPSFVRLIGTWNRIGLDRVAPRTRAPRKREPLLTDLPAEAPTHAELVIESLDGSLGSLRVRRLRWIHVKQVAPGGEQTLATIEFDGDEHLDEPLEPRWFQFAPPKSITVENITDSYRQKVGLIAAPPPPVRGK